MKKKSAVPKWMELIFDSLYLGTAAVLGLYFITSGRGEATALWGIMALVLAGGDAFHLVPRMAAAFTGNGERYSRAMGRGKQLTSITMTLFYVLLWHVGTLFFSLELPVLSGVLYALAALRILLCLCPQNGWTSSSPDARWSLYRNIPFVLQGALVLWLYLRYGGGTSLAAMGFAIFLSFAFYMPVVLWADKYPKVGMLMLPKTCAYVWIICMGLGL